MEKRRALIVVDVQNDFCPGGALAVPRGDGVVPVINKLLIDVGFSYLVVTQDWHPENHCSFEENGGQWPRHCVHNTLGAELHPDLIVEDACFFLRIAKGIDEGRESYSGFDGNINLEMVLRNAGPEQVYVCGLATDYCVKATALDSQKAGFETFVIIDACRGVNVKKGDVGRAVQKMRRAGIKIVTSRELL